MKGPNGKRNGGRSSGKTGKNGKKAAGDDGSSRPASSGEPGKSTEKGPVRPVGPPGAASNIDTVMRAVTTPEQIAARGERPPVNLALQGGGAHGAFTWGVLDKLLEDDTLALDAISATSAGAMNAVVMAYGVSEGGRDGARKKLEQFWRAVADAGAIYSPFRKSPWERFLPPGDTSQAVMAFQSFMQLWSPYQLNPFDVNPLKDVLRSLVDFDKLKKCPHATRLFINATNVRTGKVRVFENAEVSLDVVLASACLPNVFKAVEIGNDAYWDGGYMGNPPLFPLIYGGASDDIVIVHINPIEREDVPTTAPDIADRMNEISFNSLLMSELRAIAFVARLVKAGSVDETRYKHMRIHSIRDDKEMSKYDAASKLDPDWDFLCNLRDVGRRAADSWLKDGRSKVGKESSVDIGRFL